MLEHASSRLADEIGQTIEIAIAMSGSNRRLELSGLDERIGRVCAAALDLPYADGQRFRLRLMALLDRLVALEALVEPQLPSENG